MQAGRLVVGTQGKKRSENLWRLVYCRVSVPLQQSPEPRHFRRGSQRMLKQYLRRRANNEFWIALCIALAIALLAVSLSSKSPFNQRPEINSKQNSSESIEAQKNTGNAETPVEATSQHNRYEGGNEVSEYWTIFGHRLKITDSLLVVFTFTLWWATRALVFGADETAERQLRAYIFIDGGSIEIKRTDRGRIFLTGFVQFKNFGQTPAYKVSQWVRMEIFASEPEEYTSHAGQTSSAIGPGAVTTSPVNVGPISENDIQEINARTKMVSVWGGIAYDDTFGRRQFFTFYNRSGEPMPGRGWQLTKANKADEAS